MTRFRDRIIIYRFDTLVTGANNATGAFRSGSISSKRNQSTSASNRSLQEERSLHVGGVIVADGRSCLNFEIRHVQKNTPIRQAILDPLEASSLGVCIFGFAMQSASITSTVATLDDPLRLLHQSTLTNENASMILRGEKIGSCLFLAAQTQRYRNSNLEDKNNVLHSRFQAL
mmetsp:Transcript_9977/g.20632  ORF Transcript_9977/g.20632 Transcript_9977/m.20632 type:complete len:173 (-) Transcript_9977:1442-1960(-)